MRGWQPSRRSLLEEVYGANQRWVERSLHRNEHLDEVDVALASGGQ